MMTLQEIAGIINKKGRFWIVFTGDSKTSCEWVHPNWREIVEYVLKEELQNIYADNWRIPSWGIRGFNFAYDGATTKDVLDKASDINLVKPDVLISIMGSNDRRVFSPQEHADNITKIIDKIKTKVVWCTSILSLDTARNEVYDTYANALLEITENKDLKIINMLKIFKDFPLERFFTFKEKNGSDLTHPNQLGNAYIAKVILKEVFEIDFDPELYWADTLSGEKYPKY